MTTTTSVVPGKVLNNGIRDISIPDYQAVSPSTPIHLPVVHMVTPKGELGTQFVPLSQITSRFGNLFKDNSLYYNPNAVLLKQLALGGQARTGLRRLTANTKVARIPLSAYVQKKSMPTYERDSTGQFKIDKDGNRIPLGTQEKLFISIKIDDTAAATNPGELKARTIAGATEADPETHVLPLFELPAGVGDAYNKNGINFGVYGTNLNWQNIAKFVANTGVYPFNLRMFETTDAGIRAYSNTVNGGDTAQLTLFDAEYNDTKYSLKRGVQAFTGRITSDTDELRPTPFKEPIVYQDNIELLAQMMYAVEKPLNTNLIDNGAYSYRQMNPFTCQDHTGVPYFGAETDVVVQWDMSFAIQAQFGISPFLDDDGKVPSYITQTKLPDPFNILGNAVQPMTQAQAWEINDKLTLADLTVYIASSEQQNVMINRQSIWWDVGYSMEVKEKAAELLGVRKDIYVAFCGSVWTPGSYNEVADIYSRVTQITSIARLFPESEKWGTASCRFSVNKIEAIPNSEDNDWPMSGNLDLAQKWAQAGGNEEGIFKVSMSPDHGDYRIMDTMHSPNITFEEDLISANGLLMGAITLRPYDSGRFFRPALPTGYATSIDSVIKDQVPVMICIAIEKIAQSKWGLVCSDTTLSEENYAALVKDAIERDVRDNLGGYVRCNVVVQPVENVQGGEAVMKVVAYCGFNKAKYMMEFDLFADNVTNFTADAA